MMAGINMTTPKQKLELTWIGKDKRPRLEPRIFLEDKSLSYQSAKVMKDSKSEGGTVLNLNLKDKAKGRWSGNAKLGGGAPSIWEEELFAAKLSATNQTAITLKTNNSGKDILSENKN